MIPGTRTMSTERASPASSTTAPTVQGQLKTNPYIGIVGVFLGATIATINTRLLSVGLPDLRGAIGAGIDEASWIPTTLNMAMMFSGVFCVFISAFFGPRRVLLVAAGVFTITSLVLPFSPTLWMMLALQVIAGIAGGTFYSLTLTFVLTALPKRLIIFGLAAYAGDIIFTSNVAAALQGWYAEHLSWHWIFWTAGVSTPLMMFCIYFGIPQRAVPETPRPSWRGFIYLSVGLSLLFGALDQGEHLDWLNSGVIVAMLAAGLFLVAAAAVRRIVQPNPLLNFRFLSSRNIIILALSIVVFKFVHLATVVLVPGFLGNIQQYRAAEIGAALAWVALPELAVVWLVAVTVIFTNSRLVLAVGLTIIAACALIYSRVDASWTGNNFSATELVLAVGLACAYIGLVSSIVLEGFERGVLNSAANAATFSGFMHIARIFGGQVGVAIMTHCVALREKFHSNMLGLNVQAGHWLTDERLRMLTGKLLPASSGTDEAQARAVGLLSRQVGAQAYTLAISDGFMLIGWVCVGFLMVMPLMRHGTVSYQDLRKMR